MSGKIVCNASPLIFLSKVNRLAYVKHSVITNADIRTLFGLSNTEMSKASRPISATIKAGLIKPIDSEAAPKIMKYIPFWA
jgi:hypothetical protein